MRRPLTALVGALALLVTGLAATAGIAAAAPIPAVAASAVTRSARAPTRAVRGRRMLSSYFV